MNTLRFEDVQPGMNLPELAIDITARLIVGAAIASRDYQDVHHDRDGAQAAGSPDIFMNILTSNGLVGRYVTDWCGAGADLARINIRLGVPNYPGDCMRLNGVVSSKQVIDGERRVCVDVSGSNRLGKHVTGQVELLWREEAV